MNILNNILSVFKNYKSEIFKYEALTPCDNADKNGKYSEALKDALGNDKIKNIAISGSYGSGKSSFLRTFEKKYQTDWNYLNISLATFKNELDDVDTSTIERSILQQMFYKVENKTIPHSRFKRINLVKHITLKAMALLLLIISALIFFESNLIKNLYFPKDLMIIPALILMVGFVYFSKKLIKHLGNIKLSKINLNNLELTQEDKDSEFSILNKHLDEILYFFEATKYNVVVIEDLDRFGNSDIFTKLRELNKLINDSKQIGRKIVFVYAIKDDMFDDKKRTKFFDFMIPIIPFINSSNSYDQIIKRFSIDKFDKDFLFDISLYIDDMRLLKNIHNEYEIYESKIEINDKNKLLAMVIYKNMYPSDFEKLHFNKGMIYDIFNNKLSYTQTQIDKLDEKIKRIKEEIQNISNEEQHSIQELRMIYLYKLVYKLNTTSFSIDSGNNLSIRNLIEDSYFNTLLNANKITTYDNRRYGGGVSFKQIEDEIDEQKSYTDRSEFILNKSSKKLEELKKNISLFESEKKIIKAYSVQEIIKNINIFEGDISDKNLLKYLIRHGYLDEDYHLYISYFFEGSITRTDKDFLLSIKDDIQLDFGYKLQKKEELLNKIRVREFESKSILNFDLIDYIMRQPDKYKEQKEKLFLQLSSMDNLIIIEKFIIEYIDTSSYKKLFIKELCKKYKLFWYLIEKQTTFSKEKIDEYLSLLLESANIENIIEQNDGSLESYISNLEELTVFSDVGLKKSQQIIDELSIKFIYIAKFEENKELLDYIYENNYYDINYKMINQMVYIYGEVEEKDNLSYAHLTTIRNSEATYSIDYIDKNINQYVENVFLKIVSNTKESEETVLYLLNNEKISIENKIEIIQKEEIKISNITDVVDKELWIELFKDNKLVASWDNILYYYQKTEELSEEIIDYSNIEDNYMELSQNKIYNELFDELLSNNLNTKILLCNDISDKAYIHLIKSIKDDKYYNLNIQSLSSIKIDILLRENKIVLSQDSIDRLKENFASKHITLIENFKDEFIEKFDDFEIDENDLVLLLKSNKFELKEKFAFIEKSDLSDIEDKISIKETISKFYIDNAEYIENIDLFDKLFYGKNQYDLQLLILQIPYLDNCDSCKVYLDEFGEPYDKLLENIRGYVQMDNTNINQSLLEALKEKDCIGEYPIRKKKINAYRKWTN